MGSRGFGATKRDNSGRLGSVSDYCVRHCVCPVVVVRYPEEKDGGGGAEPVVSVASAVEDEEEEEPEYHDATDHRKGSSFPSITSWNSTEDSVNCRLFLLLLIFHGMSEGSFWIFFWCYVNYGRRISCNLSTVV
ncbi:hypothetical protein RHGRI_009563 [Rhododendron griersonianum]|uniref:UspA domain-containing protein n=1 Tax=Rhododendron griersonianum TaxID=479676 RepID=A0AAV6KGA7_9ERIC|nr:hypothetical protein RHGRI_009563 [Rhododendron griersonianum]